MSGRSVAARTLRHLLAAAERSQLAERNRDRKGLLQSLDARTKLISLALLAGVSVSAHTFTTLLSAVPLLMILVALSRVDAGAFLLLPAGAVTFSLSVLAPSLVLTPGDAISNAPVLRFVTLQGLRSFGFVLLRVFVAAAGTSLVISTTPWAHLLKALRVFRIPVIVVVILSMTSRYLFVLLHLALDLIEARESRRVGRLRQADERRLIVSSVAVLMSRALTMSDEIFMAMRSRGFSGEVYTMDDLRMRVMDWTFLAAAAALTVFALLTR